MSEARGAAVGGGGTEATHLHSRIAEVGHQLALQTPVNALLGQAVDRVAEQRGLPGACPVAGYEVKPPAPSAARLQRETSASDRLWEH